MLPLNVLWHEGVAELLTRSSAVVQHLRGLVKVDIAVIAPKEAVFCGARIGKVDEVAATLPSCNRINLLFKGCL